LYTVDVGGVDGQIQEGRRQLVKKAVPEDAVKVLAECQTLWTGETKGVASDFLAMLPPDAFEMRLELWYYDVLAKVIGDRLGSVYVPKVAPRSGCRATRLIAEWKRSVMQSILLCAIVFQRSPVKCVGRNNTTRSWLRFWQEEVE
jgi:hypothetical protein